MFKKNQAVTFIRNWDSKGTVAITPAIVHSCGKKRMVLTHATTGVELGREFRPQREGWSNELVVDASEDAHAVAMEMAIRIREKFITYETKMIEESNGSEYWMKRKAVLDEVIAGSARVVAR